MISQKQAIINVVLSTFPDYQMGGEVILKSLLTTENKKAMKSILFEAFRAREVVYSRSEANLDNDVYLNKYVAGLLDNWVRKNPEFNNGAKYVAKNPGSRAGSGDESVREMRKMLKGITDETIRAEIQEAIDARIAEVKPNSVITINAEAIPEHLRHLLKTDK